jgi:outer membrane protein assembly factor BamD
MKKFFFLLVILSSTFSCSIKEETVTEISGGTLEEQMIEAYNEGLEALDKGDVYFAAKKFNEAELLYPQSEWASKSSLMASYAYWSQGYYNDSIIELKRFIRLYPKNKNLDYANYLLAMNYYDSIVDEKKI